MNSYLKLKPYSIIGGGATPLIACGGAPRQLNRHKPHEHKGSTVVVHGFSSMHCGVPPVAGRQNVECLHGQLTIIAS